MDKWMEGEVVEVSAQLGESIGSWLCLVAIGIVLNPIMNFLHVQQLLDAAQKANWDIIWQKGSMTVMSIVFEFGIQGYMLIFSLILATLFFGKKSNFPKMFIIYVLTIFGLGVIGAVITASIPNITPELVGQALAFPFYVFLFGLIWIPYFLKSKRVKRTFVVGSPNKALKGDALAVKND